MKSSSQLNFIFDQNSRQVTHFKYARSIDFMPQVIYRVRPLINKPIDYRVIVVVNYFLQININYNKSKIVNKYQGRIDLHIKYAIFMSKFICNIIL